MGVSGPSLLIESTDSTIILIRQFRAVNYSHKVKSPLIVPLMDTPTLPTAEVKVPKLDVPTFHGNIIH